MPPVTTIDEAWRFGLFMLRAVIDGRGQRIANRAKVNLLR
jgi:pyruvate dehydrogenase (quinone)